MAEHTPTTSPTRRAALALGGAFASVGLTAGAAARVAAIGPAPTHPDAELIALCGEYAEAEDRHHATCARQTALSRPLTPADSDQWDRLDDIATDAGVTMGRLENAIAHLSAQTPAGVRAKAEATLRCLRFMEANREGNLALSLARDVLGRA